MPFDHEENPDTLCNSQGRLSPFFRPGTGSSPHGKGVRYGKFLQDEYLQPGKTYLPTRSWYMTLRVSLLAWHCYGRIPWQHMSYAEEEQKGRGA